jgi:hypothetical protein
MTTGPDDERNGSLAGRGQINDLAPLISLRRASRQPGTRPADAAWPRGEWLARPIWCASWVDRPANEGRQAAAALRGYR